MQAKLMKTKKFDIDGGYITKSPCRDCAHASNLPECSSNCQTLSQLQALLAGIISCSNDVSEYESYSLLI
jgi:hypothetical protein